MKKISSLILAILILATLTGCNVGNIPRVNTSPYRNEIYRTTAAVPIAVTRAPVVPPPVTRSPLISPEVPKGPVVLPTT